jgi:signal transduction histidine kinase
MGLVVEAVPPAALSDILITQELEERAVGPAEPRCETQVLHEIARRMVDEPRAALARFVGLAVSLCGAGTNSALSGGISQLETKPDGGTGFRWRGLAGQFKVFDGDIAPRHFSPFGLCTLEERPILLTYPERYFPYLFLPGAPIVEGLLVPIQLGEGECLGVLWIFCHDERLAFTAAHVRMLEELAVFVGIALRVQQKAEARQLQLRQLDRRIQDSTAELLAAEAILREAEKRRALGQMASGVAAEIEPFLAQVPTMVAHAGEKLLEKLRVIAREQELEPELVDLNARRQHIQRLVSWMLPVDISLDLDFPHDLAPVRIDSLAFDSALLQLAGNAAAAMPRGGRLAISAGNGAPGEDMVYLKVEDDGFGMPAEILEKAKEPYFTTKPGSVGLGLSLVDGFVARSGGTLGLASTPGRGTLVTLRLPRG